MTTEMKNAQLSVAAQPGISHPPVERELVADEIRWDLPPTSPWPSAAPVVALVIEALPAVEDDLGARLIERLAVTAAGLVEELRAARVLLSGALAQLHQDHLMIGRLRRDLVVLREARRSEGRAA